MPLAEKNCVPCRGDVPPLDADAVAGYLKQLEPGWESPRNHHLVKSYKISSPTSRAPSHSWAGSVWTHKIDGLTESDFVFSAKCDGLAN